MLARDFLRAVEHPSTNLSLPTPNWVISTTVSPILDIYNVHTYTNNQYNTINHHTNLRNSRLRLETSHRECLSLLASTTMLVSTQDYRLSQETRRHANGWLAKFELKLRVKNRDVWRLTHVVHV
ncbi:hypothetical protein PIB30_035324 [Stylosanthes scabra]|uniref:Uncharacterized protein n=1 Tax=Stylosanthes scabra TaxID=79078 RepID=A0ABU6SEN9_9FABA|nr:hypothetical protein [Stylosanthes scabra]